MGTTRLLGCLAALALTVAGIAPAAHAAPRTGRVVVVQAMPGTAVDVRIDGRRVATDAKVGKVLGPFDLAAGSHEVRFTDGDVEVSSSVEVSPGSSSDVVLHQPAAPDGDPVVHLYPAPMEPISAVKARILVAHTATVAPADVHVDGKVVFTNIANGEFAQADVPGGRHVVELLPTGRTDQPILGPLELTLEPCTLAMVYAVGNPSDGSMDVIVRTETLASDGTVVPDTIETGMARLVLHAPTPFTAAPPPGHGLPRAV